MSRSILLIPAIVCVAAAAQQSQTDDVSLRDVPLTFNVRVNLVTVPVVVTDATGRAVGNLVVDDFRLFDAGRPQVISRFAVERRTRPAAAAAPEPTPIETAAGERPAAPPPNRYIAYIFDDVHADVGALMQSKEAAERHLAATLGPADRAAVFSISGDTKLDFTGDQAKLRDAVRGLKPQHAHRVPECPPIDYYTADQIENKHDADALRAAKYDAVQCSSLPYDRRPDSLIERLVHATAGHALEEGEFESHLALESLRAAIHKLAVMPGERMIVLISPGFFLIDDLRYPLGEVMDHAIQAGVRINALDARGLDATLTLPDIEYRAASSRGYLVDRKLATDAALGQPEVLFDLTNATGGKFAHNTNDLAGGLASIVEPPEYTYMLGFTPQSLKPDGLFHALKVTVAGKGYTVAARRGYYAPKTPADPVEAARRDIRDAVFSREEMHGLPVELHTQFFRTGAALRRLSVLAHVGLHQAGFRKEEGQNRDDLTVVSALFDGNGNYVAGKEKVLELHVPDEALLNRLASGVTVKTTFDVAPGSYLVRLVVRDGGGQTVSAENRAIEIP
jgi:VWFA-related protein